MYFEAVLFISARNKKDRFVQYHVFCDTRQNGLQKFVYYFLFEKWRLMFYLLQSALIFFLASVRILLHSKNRPKISTVLKLFFSLFGHEKSPIFRAFLTIYLFYGHNMPKNAYFDTMHSFCRKRVQNHILKSYHFEVLKIFFSELVALDLIIYLLTISDCVQRR